MSRAVLYVVEYRVKGSRRWRWDSRVCERLVDARKLIENYRYFVTPARIVRYQRDSIR